MIFPDPHKDQPVNQEALDNIIEEEAIRFANGERIVLAYLIRRAITAYLARTTTPQPVEYRWTDTNGTLHNRDGLEICGAQDTNGDRCIDGVDHPGQHLYRERTIR